MIIRKKRLEQLLRSRHEDGKREGLWEIVGLLKKKDKIYLEPLTIAGDNQHICMCAFFGTGKETGMLVLKSKSTERPKAKPRPKKTKKEK